MYDFVLLKDLSAFEHLIPKDSLKKIAALKPEIKLIAFGALDKEVPVGICVASLNPYTHLLEVLHLEVEPAHRNKKIGTTLLSRTQEEAKNQGAKIFSFIYPQDTSDTPFIEKILTANQWKGTRPFLIRAWFAHTFDPAFFHMNFRYPKGYKIFKWKYLKPKQREDLLHREYQKLFLSDFSPFNEEEKIEFLNSVGLEYKGRVVGWLITHNLDPETIRYSAIYIEPRLQYRGLAMNMLVKAATLHKENSTKMGLLEIPHLLVDASYVRLVEKFLPFAAKVIRYRQGWNTTF